MTAKRYERCGCKWACAMCRPYERASTLTASDGREGSGWHLIRSRLCPYRPFARSFTPFDLRFQARTVLKSLRGCFADSRGVGGSFLRRLKGSVAARLNKPRTPLPTTPMRSAHHYSATSPAAAATHAADYLPFLREECGTGIHEMMASMGWREQWSPTIAPCTRPLSSSSNFSTRAILLNFHALS